jgi:light-regulated signal transduction histidine kinase (bacteriophytochrome)
MRSCSLHSSVTNASLSARVKRKLLKGQDDLDGSLLCRPGHDHKSLDSTRSGHILNDSRFSSLEVNTHATSGSDAAAGGVASCVVDGVKELVTYPSKHAGVEGAADVSTCAGSDTSRGSGDDPVHLRGAVQRFGFLVAIEKIGPASVLPVRIASENSEAIIGRTPEELFALNSFTDIFADEQANEMNDILNLIEEQGTNAAATEHQVFTVRLEVRQGLSKTLWCTAHRHAATPGLIICEFEPEDDQLYPLVPPAHFTSANLEGTPSGIPMPKGWPESTKKQSRPLRIPQNARKRSGGALAMDVLSVLAQVQEQLAAAPDLDTLLKVLVGIVKTLTGFHRVMIYRFDQALNGRVVTELVDPELRKDSYKGLNFPASDMLEQAEELYAVDKVRVLYDRELEAARLVYRTAEDLNNPLDLTHSYLRAVSPVHLRYLESMAVRSSMSISIDVFDKFWGLIVCHSYGPYGMRVSSPTRKMCRLVSATVSKDIERLSHAACLQASGLINTVSTEEYPSGYITASSEDLLKLFTADFALISLGEETKLLGELAQPQEALAMLEYLRIRKATSVVASTNITREFPDLRYPPGFRYIAGILFVPFSVNGTDFIVFFRKGRMKETRWAGYAYGKTAERSAEDHSESRGRFKTWSEMTVSHSSEWTEQEIETAVVLSLVYGKFIRVWQQKETALRSSQLAKLLLANSAHEIRTPLNAIINYLEIALEGELSQETRDDLNRSHAASKSLIHIINDLLDLTTTEGGLPAKEEPFGLKATLREATDIFRVEARRRNIPYDVILHPRLPRVCIGNQRLVRHAISKMTANAIRSTNRGGIKVEMCVASRPSKDHIEIEVIVTDTGSGVNPATLDNLFQNLTLRQFDLSAVTENYSVRASAQSAELGFQKTSDINLAVVASVIRSMNGELKLRYEEGKGSQFVMLFPFHLPASDSENDSPTRPLESCRSLRTTDAWDSSRKASERVLVSRILPQDASAGGNKLANNLDVESLQAFKSGRGVGQKGNLDKLIEILQEPHLGNEKPSIIHDTSGA